MKLRNFLLAANALVKATFFVTKVPLVISWNLTFRCNQRCLYCRMWQNRCPELGTSEILNMIDQFSQLGTRWISFTGGEPLLREDIGKIIKYTKNKNIYASVNSNGKLVSERIEDLRGVDRIKLSLDGSRDIHDLIRGEGSFEKVIEAVKVCQKNFIPVYLECTLSKYNLDCIYYLIKIALKYRVRVLFQPATKNLLYSNEPNPIIPSEDTYKETIKKLIKLKKQGAPIYNSLAGLKHLYYWPMPKKINCSTGKLSVGVAPDGAISACNRFPRSISGKISRKINIKEELLRISYQKNCKQCWCCSLVEFNLIASLNSNAMVNFVKNN